MRLTLRTLLAYRHGLLEPRDEAQVEQKLVRSHLAQAVSEAIDDALLRNVTVESELDARTVARYLDDALTPAEAVEFERSCMSSDMLLEEVASCHQLLSRFLQRPAAAAPHMRDAVLRRLDEQLPPPLGDEDAPNVEFAVIEANAPPPAATEEEFGGILFLDKHETAREQPSAIEPDAIFIDADGNMTTVPKKVLRWKITAGMLSGAFNLFLLIALTFMFTEVRQALAPLMLEITYVDPNEPEPSILTLDTIDAQSLAAVTLNEDSADEDSDEPDLTSVEKHLFELAGGDVGKPTEEVKATEAAATASGAVRLGGAPAEGGRGAQVEFMGVGAHGNRIIYVVDASRSMFGDRFTTAREELLYSVRRLHDSQQFTVIFFSDRRTDIYPSAKSLATADAATFAEFELWLQTVHARGGTYPATALKIAAALEPDVIFFLSDGIIPDYTVDVARRAPERSVINTIGFKTRIGEELLKQIALENRGQYRFVD